MLNKQINWDLLYYVFHVKNNVQKIKNHIDILWKMR
jgi:hypothetical protein